MIDFIIEKAKTVCFSGHRTLEKDFNKLALCNEIIRLIETGYDTFLVGMAVGFDTECFRMLYELKNKNDIKIIACIPCLNQSERFNSFQKAEYDKMLTQADEKIVLSEKYHSKCMQIRNEFMVDNASVLVSYLRKDYGGTKNTVKYAEKVNCKIIRL